MIKRLCHCSSPLLRSAVLVAVLLGAILSAQEASAYVIPRRASNRDSQVFYGYDSPLYFNRHLRSRLVRSSSRSSTSSHPVIHLSVNVTSPQGIVAQDEQTVIECEATGAKTPVVYWLKNGDKISQENNDGINLIMLEEGEVVKGANLALTSVKSKLFIDCASVEDEAEYTCVAVSDEATESATYKLQVSRVPNLMPSAGCRGHAKKSITRHHGTPARITMWTNNKLAPSGANVVLVCRAQGSPNAVISWIIEDTQQIVNDQDSERVRVLDNGDLEIKNIRWADMGGYTCVAENAMGSDRQMAFLYPYALPR